MGVLEITINGTEEYVNDAIQMEDNYPLIHRKVIWEKVSFTGLFSGKKSLEREHRNLIESFRRKRENPNTNQYIDSVALNNNIKVRYNIAPINPKRYSEKFGCILIGDLASNGICFDRTNDRKEGSMDYNSYQTS